VSNSADPLGPWRNYRFNAMLDGATATNNWADFPALGVDHQAVYVTSNMFAFGGAFQYAKIRVIPKAGPYAGGAAPYFDFVRMKNADNTVAFTVQPCHTFGAPQVEYLVNTGFPSGNFLTLWQIANPTSKTPTLTRQQATVSPYALAPNADQSGGAQPLNTGDVHHRAQLGRRLESRGGAVVPDSGGYAAAGRATGHLWHRQFPLFLSGGLSRQQRQHDHGLQPFGTKRVRLYLVHGTPLDGCAGNPSTQRVVEGGRSELRPIGWRRSQSLGRLQWRRRGSGQPTRDLVL
jgi:hypothetical protein